MRVSASLLLNTSMMPQTISRVQSDPEPVFSAHPLRTLRLGGESYDADAFTAEAQRTLRRRREFIESVVGGLKRRWARERRRRKVGRAYDMALEIARVIPPGSEVLDVGCGNGFIAHHLSAMLGRSVVGIDLGSGAEAAIDYRQYDGARFPAPDKSFSAASCAGRPHCSIRNAPRAARWRAGCCLRRHTAKLVGSRHVLDSQPPVEEPYRPLYLSK